MGTDRDSTHTVVVRTENRGIRVVVGAAVLYLWLRWWWTGSLFASVASAVVQTYSKPIPQRRVDLDKVAAALQSQDTGLDDLDRLVSELHKRIDGHANRLSEIEAAHPQGNASSSREAIDQSQGVMAVVLAPVNTFSE